MPTKNIISYLITVVFGGLFIFKNNLLFVLASIVISTVILFIDRDFKKYMKQLLITYIIGLSFYLFIDANLGRDFMELEWNLQAFKSLLADSNFIPFKTIAKYVGDFVTFKDNVFLKDILLNLLGNLICLIPLAIFIPFFRKDFRDWRKFSGLIIIIGFAIELLQLLTFTGLFDVDDIILNSLGGILFYLGFNKEINRFYDGQLLKENKRKELRILVIKIVLLLLVSGLFLILYVVGKKKEYDYYFYKIEVLNYSEVCKNKEENLIYEDEVAKYYMECENPKDLKIKINGEIYLFGDYLNGKTNYVIDLNKFESTGINLKSESKSEYLTVCFPKGKFDSRSYKIKDNSIVKLGSVRTSEQNDEECFKYSLYPQKVGKTEMEFYFEEKVITYYLEVDDNLKLKITKQ